MRRIATWVLATLLLSSPIALGANLTALSVKPTSVVGRIDSVIGTVTLDAGAPAGGAVVTLSSDDAAASVPGSVIVAESATTASFSAPPATDVGPVP